MQGNCLDLQDAYSHRASLWEISQNMSPGKSSVQGSYIFQLSTETPKDQFPLTYWAKESKSFSDHKLRGMGNPCWQAWYLSATLSSMASSSSDQTAVSPGKLLQFSYENC